MVRSHLTRGKHCDQMKFNLDIFEPRSKTEGLNYFIHQVTSKHVFFISKEYVEQGSSELKETKNDVSDPPAHLTHFYPSPPQLEPPAISIQPLQHHLQQHSPVRMLSSSVTVIIVSSTSQTNNCLLLQKINSKDFNTNHPAQAQQNHAEQDV